METEEEVDILMSSDVYSATLSTKSITFSRAQTGWLFREDKTVCIQKYNICRLRGFGCLGIAWGLWGGGSVVSRDHFVLVCPFCGDNSNKAGVVSKGSWGYVGMEATVVNICPLFRDKLRCRF